METIRRCIGCTCDATCPLEQIGGEPPIDENNPFLWSLADEGFITIQQNGRGVTIFCNIGATRGYRLVPGKGLITP